ncbi:winged helix-turn-helix transcriptional regulator [Brevundimonas sp. UBA5936]|jgi:DNA-binding HxlR family transcriptional regulator|uniref:winged helix-turn-helix transcriptional regulator n=1 Tax=Brevundimonas sp. UBA5936 TaxID=1946133 RepID=UPI0025C0058B|nr:helix-turn-helix domain-containing protein [Brevundimonas sp. UBA5936]
MDMTASTTALPDCTGVGDILSRVGDKWSVQIVVVLHRGPERFNSIKRHVPGISQQMLTSSLKGLERDGLVSRTVRHTTPPQVEYRLTPLGVSLSASVRQLAQWAIDRRAEIGASRDRFDERRTAPAK